MRREIVLINACADNVQFILEHPELEDKLMLWTERQTNAQHALATLEAECASRYIEGEVAQHLLRWIVGDGADEIHMRMKESSPLTDEQMLAYGWEHLRRKWGTHLGNC